MTIFVVYPSGVHKAVKEFRRATEALSFAEEKDGKMYFEKEGVKYPDEDKERAAACGNKTTAQKCK